MDANKIKKNIALFLLSLPLVILCYESFMTIAVGNRAWAMLLAGQVLVPALALLFAFLFDFAFMINSYLANIAFIVATVCIIVLTVTLVSVYGLQGKLSV